MHAAVWSQPVARSKLRRCEPDCETPQSVAGKTVLGVGIFMALFGGLLVVFGITGYFVRGVHKYHLSYGIPDGILTLVTGLCGIRSVSRRKKLKRYATLFAILTLLTVGSSTAMVVLGSAVLFSHHSLLLLTLVIGGGEAVLAVLSIFSALTGLGVIIRAKFELVQPIPSTPDVTNSEMIPESLVLHAELGSPNADLCLITDIRARI